MKYKKRRVMGILRPLRDEVGPRLLSESQLVGLP